MTRKSIPSKPCQSNNQPVLQIASKRRETASTSPKAKRHQHGESAKEPSNNGSRADQARAASPALLSKASLRLPEQSENHAFGENELREGAPSRLRLETAIQETRAFLLLMADAEGGHRYGDFTDDRGEAIQAGISSLSMRLGDALASAFYSKEEEE